MTRKEREIKTIMQMVGLYCKHHHPKETPGNCNSCRELAEYAISRIILCPKGDNKKSCRVCEIHCYSPGMKSKIREVMRYSGPRMLFVSPIGSILHLLHERGILK